MAVECAVITGFFILMSIVFVRSHHNEWALATLPLTLVPLTNFVLQAVVISAMRVNVNVFAGMLTMVIAVAISAAWIGVSSQLLKNKKTSLTYVGISNVFNVALAAIVIGSMLEKSGIMSSFIS